MVFGAPEVVDFDASLLLAGSQIPADCQHVLHAEQASPDETVDYEQVEWLHESRLLARVHP